MRGREKGRRIERGGDGEEGEGEDKK
jgi:hypothetical protein